MWSLWAWVACDVYGRPLNVRPALATVHDPAAGPVEIRLEAGMEVEPARTVSGIVLGPDGKARPKARGYAEWKTAQGRRGRG